MNKNNKSNLVKVFISITLIGSFIYYFFGKNPERLFNDLLNKVDYLYVILSIIFGGIAYVSRGIRWIILIMMAHGKQCVQMELDVLLYICIIFINVIKI